MKKYLPVMLILAAGLLVFGLFFSSGGIKLTVEGEYVDCAGLPNGPYIQDGHVMVPLEKTALALGYGFAADGGSVSIWDEYTQKATFVPGSDIAVIESKLKVIDLSREVKLDRPAAEIDSCVYVPREFFTEFFNDIHADERGVDISASKSELH